MSPSDQKKGTIFTSRSIHFTEKLRIVNSPSIRLVLNNSTTYDIPHEKKAARHSKHNNRFWDGKCQAAAPDILTPVSEQDLPLRIRELIRLEQHRLRPTLALFQLQIVLAKKMYKDELDLMAGNSPPGTRVSA